MKIQIGITIDINHCGPLGGGGGGGAASPTLVGFASATGNTTSALSLDLTALTGGSDTEAAEGDMVIVFLSVGDASNVQTGSVIGSGYSQQAENLANQGSFRDTYTQFAHKFMGATPDTSVAITLNDQTKPNEQVTVQAVVMRGVDPAAPYDSVTPVYTQDLVASSIDNGAVTPNNAPATAVVMGSATQSNTINAWDTPSDVDSFNTVAQAGVVANRNGIGVKALADASEFDPEAWTATGDAGLRTCAGYSAILKAA